MSDVNLIATTYFNNSTKDGKTQFIDVQVDHRDPRGADQANLHLKAERQEDGRRNNGAAYTSDQFAKLREAAGPNTDPVLNKEGAEVGRSFAFKGSVMPTKDNKGLVVNTNKALGHSDFELTAEAVKGQYDSMSAASAAKKTEAQTQADAPAPQAEAPAGAPAWATEAPAADQDQPAMG